MQLLGKDNCFRRIEQNKDYKDYKSKVQWLAYGTIAVII